MYAYMYVYVPMDTGVHQGSVLSPFLFTVVIDEFAREIQDEIPWCMLFADELVLVDETRDGVNTKLEQWRDTQEASGVLCDKRIVLKLKGRVYRTVVRRTLLYASV